MPIVYVADAEKAKKKQSLRKKHDHYPTPSQFVRHALRKLLDTYPNLFAGEEHPVVIDHSAGTGVWMAVLKELVPNIYGINVEYQLADYPAHADASYYGWRFQDFAVYYGDRLKGNRFKNYSDWPRPTLIMGNPPFKEAEALLRHSWALLKDGGVCFNLIPQNFVGSKGRLVGPSSDTEFKGHGALFHDCPIDWEWKVAGRISFTKDRATDNTEYLVISQVKGSTYQGWWKSGVLDWSYGDRADIPEDHVFQPYPQQPHILEQLDMIADEDNNDPGGEQANTSADE